MEPEKQTPKTPNETLKGFDKNAQLMDALLKKLEDIEKSVLGLKKAETKNLAQEVDFSPVITEITKLKESVAPSYRGPNDYNIKIVEKLDGLETLVTQAASTSELHKTNELLKKMAGTISDIQQHYTYQPTFLEKIEAGFSKNMYVIVTLVIAICLMLFLADEQKDLSGTLYSMDKKIDSLLQKKAETPSSNNKQKTKF